MKSKIKYLGALLFASTLAWGAIEWGNLQVKGTLNVTGVTTLGTASSTQFSADNLRLDGNTLSSTNANGDFTIDLNGTGATIFADLTATTVPYLNVDKKLTSSAVTPTELGYVSGVTSAIQTQIDSKPSYLTQSDNRVVRGHGTTAIQSSGVTLTDSDEFTGATIDADSNTITNIENADIKAAAAIALNKLAAVTASRALVSDGSGFVTSATTTATEIGYVNGVTSSLCGISQSCTQTSKTFTSPAINGANLNFGTATNTNRILLPSETTTNLDALTDTAGLVAYDSTQGKVVYNAGTGWVAVGSGSGGGGGINYITNPDAVTDTAGWTTYDDSAAAPVNGINEGGETVTSTFTRSTTTNIQLRDESIASGVFVLDKDAANRQGEGVMTLLDLDRIDLLKSKAIYVSFDYQTTANFVDSDICFYVYGTDSTTVTQLKSIDGTAGCLKSANYTNGVPGRFQGTFYTNNLDADFRFIAHIASTNALAYSVYIDNVRAGPDVSVPGAIITGWEAFTPTGDWSTNTTYTGFKRRVGDTEEVQIYIQTSGAPTATTLMINTPSTMDSAKLPGALGYDATTLGKCYFVDSGAIAYDGGYVQNNTTSNSVRVTHGVSSTTNLTTTPVSNTTPFTFGAGDSIACSFRYPVQGWAASAALSSTDLIFSTVKAQYSTNAGQSIPNATETVVNYEDLSTNGDQHSTVTTGAAWKFTAPKSGWYNVSTLLTFDTSATWAATENAYIKLFVNGVDTRLLDYYTAESATNKYVVIKGKTKVYLSAGNYANIKVAQTSGAALSLFNIGPNNYIDIEEEPDFSIFGVYVNVEYKTASYGNITPSNQNIYVNTGGGNSITLTRGTWRVYAWSAMNAAAAVGYGQMRCGYFGAQGTNTGSAPAAISGATLQAGDAGDRILPAVSGDNAWIEIPEIRLLVTGNTSTIYLVCYGQMTIPANARWAGSISAERLQ